MSSHRTVLIIAESASECAHLLQEVQDEQFTCQILVQPYGLLTLAPLPPVDSILLELSASPTQGLALLQRLRTEMGHCPPVIVVGDEDAATAVQAFKNGAVDYLIQSRMTPEELRLAVRNALETVRPETVYLETVRPETACPETARQASQQPYHDLAEAMPQMVWLADATGAVTYFNQRWYEYTGLSEAESMGLSGADVVHPDQREHCLAQWSQSLGEGKTCEIEYRLRRWDGQYHWFISRGIPMREEHGRITGWIGTITDIDQIKQSETATRQSEQQVRRVLDSLFSFVGVMTPAGILLEANQTALEAASLQPADVLGKPFEQAYWWAYSPEIQAQLRSSIERAATGETVRYDVQVRLGEEQFIIIDFALVPLLDETGQVEYLIPSGIDITDRKQLEASLRQSQMQLQQQLAEIEAIYQSAPIGLNVLDADLRFVRINQQLAEINGWSVEDHIGRTVQEILPDLAGTVEQLLYPILATGEPLLNVEIQGETPAQPGVKRIWLEHFLPLKQGEQVIGISTVCEEITERVRMEAALRQSEERFRTMADHAPTMIWVTDPAGYCTYLCKSWYAFTGQTEATGLGLGWLEVVHPDDRAVAREIFLQANQRHEAFQLEYRLRRQDGEYRWAIDAANPWFGEEGEFKGFIGSVIDISDRKQAEEALRRSEERYRTLFESMTEGFCVVEMLFDQHQQPYDYRFLEVNPRFEEYTGLRQPVGQTARQLIPNLEEYWVKTYGNVALTGEPVRFESGSAALQRWFDVSAFPIGSPENRKVAILFKEVSERKQFEQELKESEARFRTLADNISQFAWMTDEKGAIFWYNQRWFDYTGTTLEEMQGWGWQQVHHPDHVNRVVAKFRRCIASGETWEDTFPLRGKDHQYRWFLSRAIPVRDLSGKVLRWFGTNTDITDRKRAEEALRQSEERYRCLAELIPQLVWTANNDGVLLDVNQRWTEFTGITLEQATSTSWEQIVHLEDVSLLGQRWAESLQQGIPYEAEGRMRRADGQYRWHLHQAIPQRNEQGQIVKWFGTATDIEAQKHLEIERSRLLQQEQSAREAAERANRLKDEFLAVLSHELRSPLNPILGWSKLLQTRQFDPAKTAEALATIERNAKLQIQLIDDLLDNAKILRGKLSLNTACVELSAVVEAAIDTVRTAVAAKSISLQTDLPPIGQVSGDAARLQQICWNLLSNAVKFSFEGGQVQVRLERVGNQAQLTVRDQGKGISADFLPYIFESFRQEDSSTTRRYGGLGLGLAIVYQLVEAHGGTIRAESPGEGLGATFTVRLPLLSTKSQPQPTDVLSALPLNLTGIRVLAVDDDPDSAELLTSLLTQYGAEVLTADSAIEALNAFPTFRPHVLVSDIGMPEMNGYALIQQIRTLPPEQGGQIPAIALTAYAREEDSQQAVTSGYQRHMRKPLEPIAVAQAVMELTQSLGAVNSPT